MVQLPGSDPGRKDKGMRIDLQKSLFLTIGVIVLAACQGMATTPAGELAAITSTSPTTQFPIGTQAGTAVTAPLVTTTLPQIANCTVVSRQPTPGPTEQSLFPPVGSADWVEGPGDAAVTFIEYSDFQ